MSILTVTNGTLLEVVNGRAWLYSVTDEARESSFFGNEKNVRVCRGINHYHLSRAGKDDYVLVIH